MEEFCIYASFSETNMNELENVQKVICAFTKISLIHKECDILNCELVARGDCEVLTRKKKSLSASTYLSSRMLYVRLRKYEKFRSERMHHKSVAVQMHSEGIFFLKYIKCRKQWRFFDKFLEFSLKF